MGFRWGNRKSGNAPGADGAPAATYAPPVQVLTVTPVRDRPPPDGTPAIPLQKTGRAPDKTADMSGDKRDRERVPLEGQVAGEVMVFQPMTILDISIGGTQIETSFPLQLDSLHDFRLSLADRSIVVKGRIAHCHIEQLTDVATLYRTGVEFVGLSDHAREAIADFMAYSRAAHQPPPVVDGVVEDE